MATRPFLTQIGRAVVDRPFYDLRKITRTYEVNGDGMPAASINAQVLLPYGTADEEFTLALLVDRNMAPSGNQKSGYTALLTEVYQEFTDGEKVNVGEDQVLRLEDGRTAIVKRYVCLASQAEGLAAEVGDVLSGRACQDVKINKHGVGAEIVETYISSGKLSEVNSEKYNGALLLRTLTYFNEVPTTPSGYVLTDDSTKDTEGVPTYTYQYAKGTGEISRKESFRSSVDQGTTGLSFVTIRHLTTPSVGTDPTSSPGAGFVKTGQDKDEGDGYRIWTINYTKGVGAISQKQSARSDGSIVYQTTTLSATEATPDYPGTGTAYLTDLVNTLDDGYYVNQSVYIKPPAEDDIPVPVNFPMPGLAYFSGTQLILRPPTVRKLTGNANITYSTSKDTTAMFAVEQYGSFSEVYTPTATGIPQNSSRALGGYLCEGNTPFGTDAEYNGILCDEYSATTYASTPDTLPTGETVLNVDNDEYLMALDGTKVYRRTVLTADL